jgi:hypothetical protein
MCDFPTRAVSKFPESWFYTRKNEDLKLNEDVSSFLSEIGLGDKMVQGVVKQLNPSFFAKVVLPELEDYAVREITNFTMVFFIIDDTLIEKATNAEELLRVLRSAGSREVEGYLEKSIVARLFAAAQRCLTNLQQHNDSSGLVRVLDSLEKFISVSVECNSITSKNLTFEDALEKRSTQSGAFVLLALIEMAASNCRSTDIRQYEEVAILFAQILSFQNDIASFEQDKCNNGSLNLVLHVQTQMNLQENEAVDWIEERLSLAITQFDKLADEQMKEVDLANEANIFNRMRWMLSGIAKWSTEIPRYKSN